MKLNIAATLIYATITALFIKDVNSLSSALMGACFGLRLGLVIHDIAQKRVVQNDQSK